MLQSNTERTPLVLRCFFRIPILLLICIGSAYNSNAQLIKQTDFKEYEYKGNFYHRNDMVELFPVPSEAHALYLRAHRKRKWARKGLMLGSAVSMLGSLLVGVLPQQKYVGITLQVTGSLAFWGGLIYNINTNARYKKAIESFNRAEMETNGYQKPTSYIQIGIQPNGVGLSYLF